MAACDRLARVRARAQARAGRQLTGLLVLRWRDNQTTRQTDGRTGVTSSGRQAASSRRVIVREPQIIIIAAVVGVAARRLASSNTTSLIDPADGGGSWLSRLSWLTWLTFAANKQHQPTTSGADMRDRRLAGPLLALVGWIQFACRLAEMCRQPLSLRLCRRMQTGGHLLRRNQCHCFCCRPRQPRCELANLVSPPKGLRARTKPAGIPDGCASGRL